MYTNQISHQSKRSIMNRVVLSRGLTAVVVGLLCAYGGFMVSAISLIQERKEVRESIRQTQIAISDLEVDYFNLAQSIDTQTIQQLGFTESTVPVFAYTDGVDIPEVAFSR